MKKQFCIFLTLCFIIINNAYSGVEPSGGENGRFLAPGQSMEIKWNTSSFEGLVNIYLFDQAKLTKTLIATNIPSEKGEYLWQIPDEQTPGTRFRVRVEQINNQKIYAMSSSFFPINEPKIDETLEIEPQLLSEKQFMKISPNPVNDWLDVTFVENISEPTNILIYDGNGKLVNKQFINGQNIRLNVSNLITGTYFLQIEYYNKIHNVKFIKN